MTDAMQQVIKVKDQAENYGMEQERLRVLKILLAEFKNCQNGYEAKLLQRIKNKVDQ